MGVHADVDAGVGVAGDAQQLNGVAELAGSGDVLGADGTDTLLVHIIGGHAGAKADGGEDCRLAGGVEAVDVGGRVGLGIALSLCVGEHVGVIGALGVHARQDIVGGAVENAGDGQDLVAHRSCSSVLTMGMPPPQLASHLICTPHARAFSASVST